jgi:hypothetical protein
MAEAVVSHQILIKDLKNIIMALANLQESAGYLFE